MSTPKEILNKAVSNFLLEKLQNEGFTYFEKSTKFKKKNAAGFIYEINFLGSKTNWLNEFVNFKVQYLIFSPKYKSWHENTFPNQTILGGGYLQGDSKILQEQTENNQHGFGYDFVKFRQQDIMDEIWNNYANCGKKYFESGSNWALVHDFSTISNLRVDSLILQEKEDEALNYTQILINKYLEEFGHETGIPANSRQNFDIFLSRLNYLKKKNGL